MNGDTCDECGDYHADEARYLTPARPVSGDDVVPAIVSRLHSATCDEGKYREYQQIGVQ